MTPDGTYQGFQVPFGQPGQIGLGYPGIRPGLPGPGGFGQFSNWPPHQQFVPGYSAPGPWGAWSAQHPTSGDRTSRVQASGHKSHRRVKPRASGVIPAALGAAGPPPSGDVQVVVLPPPARTEAMPLPVSATPPPSVPPSGSGSELCEREADVLSLSNHGEEIDSSAGGSSSEDSSSEEDVGNLSTHVVNAENPGSAQQVVTGVLPVASSVTGSSASSGSALRATSDAPCGDATSLRSDIYRILGPEVCPKPRAPHREARSSALQKKLGKGESVLSDFSLPESELVSSGLAHLQSLRAGKVTGEEPLSGEAPPSKGGVFSVSHIGGFKPANYATHSNLISAAPATLEDNLDGILASTGSDNILLSGTDRSKTERMLRLAVHTLSYADLQASALVDVASQPPGQDRESLVSKLALGLDQSHRDCMALVLSCLSNCLLSRRKSVLKGAPRGKLSKSQIDRLVNAPIAGPHLFGGTVTPLIEEMSKDVRNIGSATAQPRRPGAQQRRKRKQPATSTASSALGAPPSKRSRSSFKKSKGKASRKSTFSKKKSQLA